MKKYLILLTVLLTAHISDGQLNQTLSNAQYSIQYPDEWSLDQSGQMGMSFGIFSPQKSSNDLFRENINLIEQDLSGYNMDLDQYMELNLSQLKSMIANYELISNRRIAGSNEYHQLIYNGSQGQFNLTFEQFFWVIGTRAYVLTFTSEQSEFENYRQTAEAILGSFKIK